jgi:ABC-type bacteriocin/lantibiotic exporter with double-glycine peptidase domain
MARFFLLGSRHIRLRSRPAAPNFNRLGLVQLCSVAAFDGSLKLRREVLTSHIANRYGAKLGLLIRQTLDSRPHLLRRCFKLATINHLQQLKRTKQALASKVLTALVGLRRHLSNKKR